MHDYESLLPYIFMLFMEGKEAGIQDQPQSIAYIRMLLGRSTAKHVGIFWGARLEKIRLELCRTILITL